MGWEGTAGKKFKRTVYGRTEETGGFPSINAYKISALKIGGSTAEGGYV